MDYAIASEEGKFDKYICLSNIIDILCLLSEYTSYYIASYLKYHGFHIKTKAYYIDIDSADILPIDNQSEVIISLFEDIKNSPLTLNTIREMPIELAGRLGDIYFISEELNNLDIFDKFGNPDFTDKQMIDKLVYENYNNEQVIVCKKLHELALNSRIKVEENGLISINAVPELISRFFYQFIIRFDNIILLSVDDFTSSKNQFTPIFDNAKVQLFKKPDEASIDIEQNETKTLKEKVKKLAAENEILKAKLNEQVNKPANDLKNVPHQAYKTLDKVMYAMAKITGLDNSKPYSQNTPSLNAAITTILQNDGLPLEYEAVGKWLSRINDIKPVK
ncbi:hypothetical protein I3252_05560 [Psychrobacter sp. Ps4]|uniref:hypothetical protein n=1 Tax=Psychrobacter sp. Ps4 TaxID=2790958 RepID=UPI001EDD7931|nr:hypothetical protein [Psychrobacter sp. Ps4]MCG3808951.1 hypothetical protein [Psychrobacter sp. Ps4]